ncbi:ABC transporter substrate-binding protein [Streptomyces millisiae]|uniref:Extracellular solute-binding protein n=1 Tax=Streptomyces millisiae TaxID=3075542 RepID=A0ABU2LR48_9ACTN|nr:extracellular solute-binding protein [Streptomyces sp. DSM 44918]MDT0320064.1 extracellular solute-binding protein [Streptomyces sp. DSM 44918]
MFQRILAAVAAALLLASCGIGGGASGNDGDGPTVITYWSWISGSQELVDRFNATHDDVQVAFERVPAGTAGGYSNMFNAVRAGRAPDVVTVEYPQLPGFVTQRVVQPLEPFGLDELEPEFPDWAWQQTALGGRLSALPLNIGPTVLFYRADLFEEYGYQPPTTWAEYRATAERLRADHPDATMTNFGSNDAALFAALAWQAGAEWYDTSSGHWQVSGVDEPTTRVAEYWESLIADDLVTVGPTFEEQHVTALQEGTSLTLIGGPWTAANISRFVPELAGAWGAVPLPAWEEGGAASANYGGSSLAIPEGAEHAEEAAEFIRWAATSPEAVDAIAGVNTSYPAHLGQAEVWGPGIEAANPFVAGMNLPDAAAEAAATVDPDWEWGPDMTVGFARLVDETTTGLDRPGGLADALRRWQDATRAQLRQRGFDVSG